MLSVLVLVGFSVTSVLVLVGFSVTSVLVLVGFSLTAVLVLVGFSVTSVLVGLSSVSVDFSTIFSSEHNLYTSFMSSFKHLMFSTGLQSS